MRVQELVHRTGRDPARVRIAVRVSADEIVSLDVYLAAVYLIDVSDVTKAAADLGSPPGDRTYRRGVVEAGVVLPVDRVAPVPRIAQAVLLKPPRRVQGAIVVTIGVDGELAAVVLPSPAALGVNRVIAPVYRHNRSSCSRSGSPAQPLAASSR